MSNTTHDGVRMNYYMDALKEDLECPNTGNTLNFLEAAQAELDNLRDALAAATTRAEAALAAVPVTEIRTVLRAATDVYDMSAKREDVRAVYAWLAAQGSIQS